MGKFSENQFVLPKNTNPQTKLFGLREIGEVWTIVLS